MAGHLVDVLDPALVAAQRVGREAQKLDATLGELGLQPGELAELGGADRGVVLRVREEYKPLVADELMEINRTLGRISLKVRGDGAQAEAR